MTLTLLLTLCAVMSIVAQVCLKLGAERIRGALSSPLTAWRAFLQPLIWCGGGLYAGGTVLWIQVLTQADLSFAYPFAALSYAGGVLTSQWLLKEKVSALRWTGLAIIVCGVILVATSGAQTR